jgi:hypothetical protein
MLVTAQRLRVDAPGHPPKLNAAMGSYLFGIMTVGLVLLAGAWCWRAAWRMRSPRSVTQDRQRIIHGHEPILQERNDAAALAETFCHSRLVRISDVLDEASLRTLQQECNDNLHRVTRSFVPLHKQGATVGYEALHHHAPGCLALYHSRALHRWISAVVREPVGPAADHDQSASSILYYTQPGDHIHWHYDHNFYRGRQFTVLLVLVNRAGAGGLSSSELVRKNHDGREERLEAAENVLVLFEGARVLHKVSAARPCDMRMVLSMTFNTEPRISLFWELARRIKDTAFHGWPALWD